MKPGRDLDIAKQQEDLANVIDGRCGKSGRDGTLPL